MILKQNCCDRLRRAHQNLQLAEAKESYLNTKSIKNVSSASSAGVTIKEELEVHYVCEDDHSTSCEKCSVCGKSSSILKIARPTRVI